MVCYLISIICFEAFQCLGVMNELTPNAVYRSLDREVAYFKACLHHLDCLGQRPVSSSCLHRLWPLSGSWSLGRRGSSQTCSVTWSWSPSCSASDYQGDVTWPSARTPCCCRVPWWCISAPRQRYKYNESFAWLQKVSIMNGEYWETVSWILI